MPRNIEIKARIDANLNDLIERIRPIADGPPSSFTQSDTFFNCPSDGRLKLRIQQVIHHRIYFMKHQNSI